MKRLAALACIVALAGCGDGDATPKRVVGLPTTTIDRVAELESQLDEVTARNAYLEGEIVKQAADQESFKAEFKAELERIRREYVERATASRSASSPRVVRVAGGDVWARLRQCESGGNYAANTGNGYYGAYQFSAATWRSMGTGYAYAHLAPPAVQDDAARHLQARSGWGQWPACSRRLGLR